ncbi:hypothetical protein T484DRAFT_1885216 [Baffinella frigidus]|nr:hypothetical protein T484DRAFT_1885216 [Cryptophyta sp. CCMP2293]
MVAPPVPSTSDEGGSVLDIFKQFSCGPTCNFADVLNCVPHPAPAVEAVALPARADKQRPAEGLLKKSSTYGRNSEDQPVGELRRGGSAIARASARRQNLPALGSPALTPGSPSAPPLQPTNASTAKQEQANPVVSRPRSAEQASVSRTPSAEQAPVTRIPSGEQVTVSRTPSGESEASGVDRPGSGGGFRSQP